MRQLIPIGNSTINFSANQNTANLINQSQLAERSYKIGQVVWDLSWLYNLTSIINPLNRRRKYYCYHQNAK